jgi:opacity protein-like surface antigen
MKARTSVMMALLLAFALPLASQAQWRLGANAGYDVDIKDFLIGVNAQFTIPGAAIAGVPLQFSPGFDFYPGVGSGVTYWIADMDAHYPIQARGLNPFIGGGLYMSRASVDAGTLGSISDTNLGLNLMGGAEFGTHETIRPYAEGKFRLGSGSSFIIKGGLSFILGR